MRTEAEIEEVKALAARGLNHCEIGRATGIPRSTVRDWLNGKRRGGSIRVRRPGSCPACGHHPHDPAQLPWPDYTYLLGMYLGDGCISTSAKGAHRLRITLDTAYPGIIMSCAAAMRAVMPTNAVLVQDKHGERAVEVGCSSKAWPCLFPQHGPGRKHKRRIALVEWQQEIVDRDPKQLIRGLIHSDGCRVINKSMGHEYVRYFFDNASDDIRAIFGNACDQLGIGWREPRPRTISIARRADVALLDEFVGPKT